MYEPIAQGKQKRGREVRLTLLALALPATIILSLTPKEDQEGPQFHSRSVFRMMDDGMHKHITANPLASRRITDEYEVVDWFTLVHIVVVR